MGCMDVMSAVKVLHSMADVPVTRLGEVRASVLPCVPPLNPKKLQFPVSTTGKGDFSSSRRRAKTVSVTFDDIVVANIANQVRKGYEQCDSTLYRQLEKYPVAPQRPRMYNTTLAAKQLKHFTSIDLTCYEKLAEESDTDDDIDWEDSLSRGGLNVETTDSNSTFMSIQDDDRSYNTVEDLAVKTANLKVKVSPIAKKRGNASSAKLDSPPRVARAAYKKVNKVKKKPSLDAGRTITWTPKQDQLLFSRVKRFAKKVQNRERGWAVIAKPFPNLSVAAVTTRAHKVLKKRETSIEQLIRDGFGNE
ncbi:hypothetical protein TrVE_jg5420 [Triparma verrucosa]|uniref:Myb-like domain-containing protein n=1 Tax=Triparma verrucosa TaxID=1606542 RepID=A0A9W7F594_9STRA|nr:hypothetical protein TrVE_jg5420 [Triparma verrucosa]